MWTLDPPRREHEMYRWTSLGVVSTGKQQVNPPANRRYDLIQLEVTGRVYLFQVAIEFDNHQTQVVPIRRMVDARNPLPAIDLAGNDRSVLRVIVYSALAPGGEVTVLAR